MDNGWIKLHRKSMESTIWKNPMVWFVWSWCLMKANHKDNQFPFNGKDIVVKNGSFITGLNSAQSQLPTLSIQNIRTALDYLESTNRITIKSTNKFSVITIVKWEEYQQDNKQTNKPLTNEQQTTNKPLTTNKNVKKEKNVKKVVEASSTFSLEDKLKDMELKGGYLDIIATFIREKGIKCDNSKQLSNVISRFVKVAKKLEGAYSNEQIFNAIDKIKKDSIQFQKKGDELDWSLDTIYKKLTK